VVSLPRRRRAAGDSAPPARPSELTAEEHPAASSLHDAARPGDVVTATTSTGTPSTTSALPLSRLRRKTTGSWSAGAWTPAPASGGNALIVAEALWAEGCLEAAVHRFRTVAAGADAGQASLARHRLTLLLRQLGQLDEVAEVLEAEALASAERFGANHGATLLARQHNGAALLDAQQHVAAREVLEAVVRDCAKTLGAEHPLTVTARINLALARHRAGPSVEYPGSELCRGIDPCPAVGTRTVHLCSFGVVPVAKPA
jgi:hypothetical protein